MKRFAIVTAWFNRLRSIIASIGVFSVLAVLFAIGGGGQAESLVRLSDGLFLVGSEFQLAS